MISTQNDLSKVSEEYKMCAAQIKPGSQNIMLELFFLKLWHGKSKTQYVLFVNKNTNAHLEVFLFPGKK